MHIKISIIIFMLATLHSGVRSHVRMTFPPARGYALDFIDLYRTRGPCGMVRTSSTPITTFVEGSGFTITWHLAYAHSGGVKVDLLQEADGRNFRFTRLARLTPGSSYIHRDDTTKQDIYVKLPRGLLCDSCTLRLTREASEYGGRYAFWSCADITIIPRPAQTPPELPNPRLSGSQSTFSPAQSDNSNNQQSASNYDQYNDCYEGKCLKGGVCDPETGRCLCHRLFSGSRCQYEDECWHDGDCDYHGQCIDTRSTNFPKLVCYCQAGWHGKSCDRESQITEVLSDYSTNPNYLGLELSPNKVFIYWRYVNNLTEIEIALRVRSSSWVGVGWRPQNARSSCRNLETLSDVQAKLQQSAWIESLEQRPSLPTMPLPHIDPEINVESRLGSNIEARCNPAPARYTLPESGLVTSYESAPSTEPRNRTSGGTEPRPSLQPPQAPTNLISPNQPRPRAPDPAGYNPNIQSAMDCADIVVGSVKGNLHRVQDMFTRDRASPRQDAFFGGSDDITSAIGSQVDGFTTIVFRKKTTGTHYTDHSILMEPMHLIWAKGQEINNNVHYPNSGMESCTSSDHRFYRHDELKYHGTSRRQRSATTVTFSQPQPPPTDPECETESGSFKLPQNCDSSDGNFNCIYFVSWVLNNDVITFTLKASQDITNGYVAIGISDDRSMPQSDIYTGWITDDGRPVVIDRWADGYFTPGLDSSQDVSDVSGSYVNGVITIQFSRPRDTQNDRDLSFSDTECRHLLFAQGRLTSDGSDITYHSFRQILTDSKVCIRSCDKARGRATEALTACQQSYQESVVFFQQNPGLEEQIGYPMCMDDGSFSPRQCYGTSGVCWCVDTDTGVILESRYGARYDLDC